MRIKNLAGLIACFTLVVGLTVHFAPSILPSVPQVKASSRAISLVGTFIRSSYYSGYYWNRSNPTITVAEGDSLTISLSSSNTVQHQLLIDFDNDSYTDTSDCTTVDVCSKVFPPSTSVGPFTVNSNPGTYKYYCTIHPLSMIGDFVVQRPDFGLSSDPSNLSILQGSSANSTITVSSINNFAGTINLSASAYPSGPTTSFTTDPLTVSAGNTATSKLTISTLQTTPAGAYSIIVTGTNSSGSPSRTATIGVTVTKPDFSVSPSLSSLTIAPGSSSTASITLTSTNSFSGILTLTATVSPPGPQVSFNPASVSLSPGGSNSSTLTVSTASGYYSTPVAQRSYSINVTVSSPSAAHSTTLSLIVGSTASPPTNNSNHPLFLIIGGAVGAIVVIATATYVLRRRQ